MRFVFVCGGTAGHINPAIAVADRVRQLQPESEILFIGVNGKMEMNLVPRAGYEIRGIRSSGLSRSLSLEGLKHNVKAAGDFVAAKVEAHRILKDFKPDAVLGTGGYVCVPVIEMAGSLGIPSLVHESNAIPGKATQMAEKHVEHVLVGFEQARANYRHPEKVLVTGTPVRPDFLKETREQAREALGIPQDQPFVVSVWGSLGATDMNRTVADMIVIACGKPSFRFLHSAGTRGFDSMTGYMAEDLGLADWEQKGIEVRSYIYDMARVTLAADLVLCRSGASTLAELTAVGKPCILVPSPNVVNDHQTKNARVPAEAGGAVLLPESECSGQKLYDTITSLLADKDRLAEMSRTMKSLSVENATDEITGLLLQLAAQHAG